MSTFGRGRIGAEGLRLDRSIRRLAVRGRSPQAGSAGRPRSGARLVLLVIGSISIAGSVWAGGLEPAPEGLDAWDIAARSEESLRSGRMFFEAKMTVRKSRLSRPRVLRFRWFGDRVRRRTFIRLLAPPKNAGTSFLLLYPNLWMHEPRDERITRIPSAMMSRSWMESDFNVDDLVRYTSEVDDYDHRILGIDPSPKGAGGLRAYVVEYLPRVVADASRSKIVAWIETEHGTPLRQEFRGPNDDLVRLLRYEDIRNVSGRYFPHVWILEHPADKSREARIEVEQVRFDADFEDSVFTTTNLKSVH
jgi:outer membrane lipoprotein-sorting protein